MGGYIVDHLSWNWVFWIFLPLGVVAFIMIAMLFPKVPRREGESIDYVGSAFLTIRLLAYCWLLVLVEMNMLGRHDKFLACSH